MAEDFEKKEHDLFGEDGFEKMAARVAQLEQRMGIFDLNQFTPPAWNRHLALGPKGIIGRGQRDPCFGPKRHVHHVFRVGRSAHRSRGPIVP